MSSVKYQIGSHMPICQIIVAGIACVDQGNTGAGIVNAPTGHGIILEVAKPSEAKRGFVLLPRRRVIERSFARMTCFRQLVKDDQRYAETLVDFTWSPSPAS